MAEEIEVIGYCPICKKSITFTIDKNLILNASKLPVPFRVEHCKNEFIVFIDANFICKETRLLIKDKKEVNVNSLFNNSKFIAELTPDDLIVYEYNSREGFLLDKIPDLAEKHIIRVISRNQEVSLSKLLHECEILEKALNRNIGREKLLNILNKYIEKGIIIRQKVKMEEEESSSQFKTNILQGGNI